MVYSEVLQLQMPDQYTPVPTIIGVDNRITPGEAYEARDKERLVSLWNQELTDQIGKKKPESKPLFGVKSRKIRNTLRYWCMLFFQSRGLAECLHFVRHQDDGYDLYRVAGTPWDPPEGFESKIHGTHPYAIAAIIACGTMCSSFSKDLGHRVLGEEGH